MALIADEYTWVAGVVTSEPVVESPEDGHHLVVRFSLALDRKGGASSEQPLEARGATARYLYEHQVKQGDFVMAAGIVRTEDSGQPYLLLRIVSTDTSETVGE
ncbi:MAG: hypothetical protein LKJ05_06745 [Bifidobacteriaceae bacterium]|jgi:hypothetical protein|nr:hypothetical protein [Bifidobacteriaceae bacterium]